MSMVGGPKGHLHGEVVLGRDVRARTTGSRGHLSRGVPEASPGATR
jgi:hypothetical protein